MQSSPVVMRPGQAVTYAAAPTYTAAPTGSVTYAAAPRVIQQSPRPVAVAPAQSVRMIQSATVKAPAVQSVVQTAPTIVQAAPTYATASTYATATTYAAAPVVVTQKKTKNSSPWGGGCPWQYDKTAFKEFVTKAIQDPTSKERKQLYGYLSECFLDADGDRDGLVNHDEFDFLVEKAAAMPRRFGLAPSWVECYGDVPHRQQARNEMFNQMDKHNRQKIGMEEWVEFSIAHITQKVEGLPQMSTLDFAHLEREGPESFVEYLDKALQDRHCEQYKSLYEFLFKTFVEADVDEKGAVTMQQFDILIEAAAQAPRVLGLAPSSAESYPTAEHRLQARQAEFDAMDTDREGTVSFDEFLNWCLSHISVKVQAYKTAAGQ